jgi:hypothetical protein
MSTTKGLPRQAFLDSIARELQAVHNRLADVAVERVCIELAELEVEVGVVEGHSAAGASALSPERRPTWSSSWYASPGDVLDYRNGEVSESTKHSYFFDK